MAVRSGGRLRQAAARRRPRGGSRRRRSPPTRAATSSWPGSRTAAARRPRLRRAAPGGTRLREADRLGQRAGAQRVDGDRLARRRRWSRGTRTPRSARASSAARHGFGRAQTLRSAPGVGRPPPLRGGRAPAAPTWPGPRRRCSRAATAARRTTRPRPARPARRASAARSGSTGSPANHLGGPLDLVLTGVRQRPRGLGSPIASGWLETGADGRFGAPRDLSRRPAAPGDELAGASTPRRPRRARGW